MRFRYASLVSFVKEGDRHVYNTYLFIITSQFSNVQIKEKQGGLITMRVTRNSEEGSRRETLLIFMTRLMIAHA